MSEPKLSLVQIMQALRGPGGCPWDQKQSHVSLKRFLIEECYECIEAIDSEDDPHLKEELGDVLLQVAFHSQLAEERGAFNFKDVEDSICEKMLRRHPHVFGDTQVDSVEDVKANWDAIKKQEKADLGQSQAESTGLQSDLPKSLPIIQRVQKIQDRVSRMGFEWNSVHEAIHKLEEEVVEIREAVNSSDAKHIEEELGDCFFALLKVARLLDVDPELALKKANDKFVDRFESVAEQCSSDGKDMKTAGLEQLMVYWKQAKIRTAHQQKA